MSADTLTPFFLYVVSGLPIVVLFVAASFSEQDRRKNGIVSPDPRLVRSRNSPC